MREWCARTDWGADWSLAALRGSSSSGDMIDRNREATADSHTTPSRQSRTGRFLANKNNMLRIYLE